MRPFFLVLLAALPLPACTDADPVAPSAEEVVPGGLATFVSAEGLAFLAGRLAGEDPELATLVVDVERRHLDAAGGGTVVYGAATADLAPGPVRLQPQEGGLLASVRLEPFEVVLSALHRPSLGAPERCRLRFSATAATVSGRLVPARHSGTGDLELGGEARVEAEEVAAALDEGCPEAVRRVEATLTEAVRAALARAATRYLEALGTALQGAAGLGRSLEGGLRVPAGHLRFSLRPQGGEATASRVLPEGLLTRYDVAVDADVADAACGPSPEGPDDGPTPPPPTPPPRAPGGRAYRFALALEGGLLRRALAWAAASGLVCEGTTAVPGDGLPELPGLAALSRGSDPLRLRLRPVGGVEATLTPRQAAPLSLVLPDLALDLYVDVEGASLALLRLRGDVAVAAGPELTEDGGLVLRAREVRVDALDVIASLLPLEPEQLEAAAPAVVAAALQHVLASWSLPPLSLPARPVGFVGAEATETHLLVYLDLD